MTRNVWFLPSCQSLYLTNNGPVLTQGEPLVTGTVDVPPFNREALITALRTDQAGKSTFPEFLAASWRAGIVRYDVDFAARTTSFSGLVSPGLYQFNVVVPDVPDGDRLVSVAIGSAASQPKMLLTIKR